MKEERGEASLISCISVKKKNRTVLQRCGGRVKKVLQSGYNYLILNLESNSVQVHTKQSFASWGRIKRGLNFSPQQQSCSCSLHEASGYCCVAVSFSIQYLLLSKKFIKTRCSFSLVSVSWVRIPCWTWSVNSVFRQSKQISK